MDNLTLFAVVMSLMALGAIIIAIILIRTFSKSPSIDLVQGRLKVDVNFDIDDAMKYLKIVNKE